MTWEIVVGIGTLIGLITAILTPIIKLNTSITKLNGYLDTVKVKTEDNEKRITKHGKQIDDHEHRITVLEVNSLH